MPEGLRPDGLPWSLSVTATSRIGVDATTDSSSSVTLPGEAEGDDNVALAADAPLASFPTVTWTATGASAEPAATSPPVQVHASA